jgi:hypothetical protein
LGEEKEGLRTIQMQDAGFKEPAGCDDVVCVSNREREKKERKVRPCVFAYQQDFGWFRLPPEARRTFIFSA